MKPWLLRGTRWLSTHVLFRVAHSIVWQSMCRIRVHHVYHQYHFRFKENPSLFSSHKSRKLSANGNSTGTIFRLMTACCWNIQLHLSVQTVTKLLKSRTESWTSRKTSYIIDRPTKKKRVHVLVLGGTTGNAYYQEVYLKDPGIW